MFGALQRVPGSRHIIALRESFWMLNRDSSVKSTWPHCSGVQLRCSLAHCNRALTCAEDRGTQTKDRRTDSLPSCSLRDKFAGIWAFLQQQKAATPAVALLVSSGVWHSPVSRSTSSTFVLILLIMVPQPMDDTTMHIQLSGKRRLSCTSLQHTDRPSNASHRTNGFFYSCFPIWLSRIPGNCRCL
ncbi:hypothetical protein AVEN_3442-1 [Araneus ventricosus]|uniref:Uncharacterized protein n=1 Tax=Araneus ventricosus TaxID=182803 RepID=A0A4Y2KEK9_ARAVE|nr:hypothetical protein AVEN_3442-1 [Araneus ventricosus]